MASAAEAPSSMGTTSGELAAKASDRAPWLGATRLATRVVVLVIKVPVHGAATAVLGCPGGPVPMALDQEAIALRSSSGL